MAELLLEKGYVVSTMKEFIPHKSYVTWCQVHGIIRRSSTFNTGRILHLYADRTTHTAGSKNTDTITVHMAGSFVFL